MTKVLFLGSLSYSKNRLDGVTVKSRTLVNWLKNKDVMLNIVDTDEWKKNIINILYNTIREVKRNDAIIICSADKGAYYALKLLNLLKVKKPIYYFVAGGRLAERIQSREHNKYVYDICKKIYVESSEMHKKLTIQMLSNVNIMNNFRIFNKSNTINDVGDTIKCIYFGRVIPEKGISDAIEVVNNLLNEGYDLKFDIYGQIDEQYYKEIKNKLNSKIGYCGIVDSSDGKQYDIFSKYDILLFPTKYDGECLPGTLIESYISGLAIIASEWKYAREYIKDNEVGYIFNYKDKNDMKKKIESLIKDKEKINLFKINSVNESIQYHCDTVLNEFYNSLIKSTK